MKHFIRVSHWAVAAILALGGCSGASRGDHASGDEEASRDPSAGAREQNAVQRQALDVAGDMSAVPGEREGEPGDTDPGVPTQTQSAAEAEQSDLEAIAAAQGWTPDEARLYQAKTEAVGDAAIQIDAEQPGVLVGSAVGPDPSDAPRVYIKGPADARIREITAAAPFEILVIDRQPFSRDELDERQSMLAAALLELGFKDFALSTDIQREGLMEATVERVSGAPDSEDAILAALPPGLREPTRIVLVDDAGGRDE